jgi:hypothetical protein
MNSQLQTELGTEDIKIWNEIWNDLYETHYGAFYEELCAEHSLKIWKRYDALFKAFQIITASGSAVAGWSLWQKEEFRWVWALLAGFAVLLSIIHTVLGISEKVKEDAITYSKFKGIRVQCERLSSYMKIKAYERLSDYKRDYMDLRSEYDIASADKKPDYLLSKNTENNIQSRLNNQLGKI